MWTTRNRAKNHHYIPQCYLKHFAIKYNGRKISQLSVFDRFEGRTYKRGIDSVGCQNYFNRIELAAWISSTPMTGPAGGPGRRGNP